MRIGLTLNAMGSAVAEAVQAEGLGFDYVASGEHLFFHGPTPNSFITLAAAAGATHRVRLLSSIALLPQYPAALAAKLASSLDQVSGGRFDFGVGAGGEYPAEYKALGIDVASRFRRFDESLQVLRTLFSGERGSFDGEFTRFNDVQLDPPPIQRPGPPLWLAGRKPAGIRRAGTFADVWMPYMIVPKAFSKGLAAVQLAAVEAGRATSDVSGALILWTCVDADGGWARSEGIATVSRAYNQDFTPLADRYLLLGTPAEVLARLTEFRDAGVDCAIITVAAAPEHRDRVLNTLSRDVLPYVTAAT